MAKKNKPTKNQDEKLNIKGSFEDVIKASVNSPGLVSLAYELYYNGVKDYAISIMKETNNEIITTILEKQPDREVAVFRKNHGKSTLSAKKLMEQAKATILIFPHLIPTR